VIETTELSDTDTGTWELITDIAIYTIDLDSRTGSRQPRIKPRPSSLYQEHELFRLVRLVRCTLGSPIVLRIDRGLTDKVITRQITTDLVRIRRTDPDRPAADEGESPATSDPATPTRYDDLVGR
jgi:hypothetical protein